MAVTFAEHPATTSGAKVEDLRLGIVGAGKFGTTVARAAVAAGYDVAISGSGPADNIALTIDVLAPGAHAATTDEVVAHAGVIILAVPTHRFRDLRPDLFAGKVLIDATNYWPPVDGDDPELAYAYEGTIVQQLSVRPPRQEPQPTRLPPTRREPTPQGAPERMAIGAAGDDQLAVRTVMRLLDHLGFDPVDAGPLKNGVALEPDGSPIATIYSAEQLAKRVSR
jgi:predicted dinucleotide-binding enzyme